MATRDRDDIELAFNIELETRRAMKEISNIDRALRKTVNSKLQIKAFDQKSIREFNKQLLSSRKNLRLVAFSMSPNQRRKFDHDFRDMALEYRNLTKVISIEQSKIRRLERKMHSAADEDLKKALQEQVNQEKKASLKVIQLQQKAFARKRALFGRRMIAGGASADIEKRTEGARQSKAFIEGIKAHKTGVELAEGFKEAVGAMSGKDIFGLGRAGMRLSGGLLKGLAKVSMAKGAGIAAKGAAMGGGVGAALKGLGGAMRSVGPLLASLGKIAPILGVVGSSLMALVKLFLDADAAVKEMNRTVLEGGSTWDTYAASGRNVEAGMGHLDKSLRRLRDEATDLSMNLSMGTTAKDHLQVINVLEREGVTLEQLTNSLAKYTDISKQAIVYSRLFGVSIDEIAQFQSEMMAQMGSGLNDLSKEFDLIGRTAEEAGIAQNKFFAMLRGVSSDLSLYGVRIEEVTKMLGQLGKVMSPRTADKFLKTFAQGFKGKSIQDRLKTMLLGGSASVKAIQDDISGQLKDLVSKVTDATGLDAGTATQLLAGKTVNGQSLRKLEKQGKIQGAGALIESFQKLELAQRQAKQGTYGAAQAAETAGGFAAYKAQAAGLGRFGFKSFSEAAAGGVRGHQSAVLAAGGEEQLDTFIGIERAIEQQRNDLLGAIDDPEGNEDLIKALMKVKRIDEKALKEDKDQVKKQVESMSKDELWKTLDQKNAEANKTQAEKDAEAMRKMGEEQGQRTQAMVDKLDLIFDALYNRIYGVLMDISNIFNTKFGKKSAVREQALGSKSSDVVASWGRSGGDLGKFMGELSGSGTAKRLDSLLHSTRPEDKAQQEDLKSKIAGAFVGDSLTGDLAKDLAEALKAAGISGSSADKILAAQKSGKGIGDSIAAGGLGSMAEADLYSKLGLWFTGATGRTSLMDQMGAGATPSSAQQQAASKSESPGTGGAMVPTVPPPSPAAAAALEAPAGGGLKYPTPPDEQKMNQAVLDNIDFTGDAVVNNLQDLWKAMRMKGIKLDRVQLTGDYQDVIHKGTADGARDALFEYALYTSQNPAATLKNMRDSGFGGLGNLADSFEAQQKKAREQSQDTLLGNAAGGVVTGVSGGIANVNPAPGEGLASIGRGERIVPAGTGGVGDIHIHVDGIGGADLANYLKAKVAQGVYEYKRREKFT